jgi:ELWxxDGT repeat protein
MFRTTVVNGRELWTSDGTDTGTNLVKDIFLVVSTMIPTPH